MTEELKQFLDQRLSEMEQRLMANQKTIMNVHEVANFLGKSESRIYHLCNDNLMPYHKPVGTKTLLFDKKEIEQWMLSGYVPAAPTEKQMKQTAVNSLLTKKSVVSRKATSQAVSRQASYKR